MAEGLIYKKMAAIMQQVEGIEKDQKNVSQGFKFRGIDQLYNALHGILAKNEVFMLTEVLEDRVEERQTKSGSNLIYRVLKIKYRFCTVDGSTVESTMIGEGMDSGDKACNKAMSIAHKYALLQAFCIPTEDQKDSDYETHDVKHAVISDKQKGQVIDMVCSLEESGNPVNVDAFLKYLGVSDLALLTAGQFPKAMAALEAKAKAVGK